MYIPVTSRPYMLIPIDGPPGVDLTTVTPEACLVPDNGNEPADADYHPGTWINTADPGQPPRQEIGLLIGPGGAVTYPAGLWFAWARLTAGAEKVVLPSGRVRIGNTAP